MKISEIDTNYLCNYLKLEEVEEEQRKDLEVMKVAALEFVQNYTGLTLEEMEQHEDITIAAICIIADMFDNRNYYLDYKNTKTNQTVNCILNMYARNLL